MSGKGNKTSISIDNIRAKLVCRTVVDGAGELMFTEKDAAELGKKSAVALTRVFTVSQKLSGLSNDDVEDLTEGLETAPSESSTSD